MNGDLNLADLLRQLRDDTTELVREEIRLARTEVREKLKLASRNSIMIAAGAVIGFSALLVLLMSLGYLLRQLFLNLGASESIASFLGFLIVAAVVGAAAAAMILKGLKAFKSDSLAPERTTRSLREDKEWVQRKAAS